MSIGPGLLQDYIRTFIFRLVLACKGLAAMMCGDKEATGERKSWTERGRNREESRINKTRALVDVEKNQNII